MERIKISNRKAEQAVNRGSAQILLPWPVEVMGAYGKFAGTPEECAAAMDAYVAEAIDNTDQDVMITGTCGGRTAGLRPVIVATIAQRPMQRTA